MDIEEALALVNQVALKKTKKQLTELQQATFQGVWLDWTYAKIAEKHESTETSVKQAAHLIWELLREVTDKKVTKKNFREVLEELKQQQSNLANNQDRDSASTRLKNLSYSDSQNFSSISLVNDTSSTRNKSIYLPSNLTNGPIGIESGLYIERPPIEEEAFRAIKESGALVRIKAPRQMGKTSLMLRILAQSAAENYRTIFINLRYADRENLSNLERLLQWFCVATSRQLQLPNRVDEYWDEIYGSKGSCDDYFKQYILQEIQQPLILALDDVDLIFSYPDVAEDFLALLRAWHEESKTDRKLKQLRLLLAHSTEVYIPLEIKQSPFNVGHAIELTEFTPAQIQKLTYLYGLNWNQVQVEQLMSLIGGHPYLIQTGLHYIVKKNLKLEKFLRLALSESGPYGEHLRSYLIILQEQPELLSAIQELLSVSTSLRLDSTEMFKLKSMGLINLNENDEATIRCELYRQYLKERLYLAAHS